MRHRRCLPLACAAIAALATIAATCAEPAPRAATGGAGTAEAPFATGATAGRGPSAYPPAASGGLAPGAGAAPGAASGAPTRSSAPGAAAPSGDGPSSAYAAGAAAGAGDGTAVAAGDGAALTPDVGIPANETRIALATLTPTRTPTPAATRTATATPTPQSGSSPNIGGCAVFPSNNPWNTDISAYPLHANSQNFINNILAGSGTDKVHPDFGSNPDYGIPYIVVPQSQPLVPVNFTDYGDESDPGPYPVPLNAPIEGGGDRHVLAVQQGTCKLYEMFNAWPQASSWDASNGAVWDLTTGALRPEGWTSADAAGLPILPGLVRYDEVQSGVIRHALRFTVQSTQRAYILPATHFASSSTDPNRPPMGLRLRLKATYDISGYTGQSRVILQALRTYGMIVADNGSNWFISGATDPRWDDDDLNQLKNVPGSAFEAVYTGATITP